MARREIYLWVQYIEYHHERIHGFFSTFPGLKHLEIGTYFDPRSTAVILRLSFHGSARRLREWATSAGLELIDASHWDPMRAASFRRELSPFGCRDRSRSPHLMDLADGIERAADLRADMFEEWTSTSTVF